MKDRAPIDPFAQSAGRIEELLTVAKPTMAAEPPALGEALGAACAALGRMLKPGSRPLAGEAADAAIERIARDSGLQARTVTLSDEHVGDSPVPLLAFRTADEGPPEPVLLYRSGAKWRLADRSSGWKPGPIEGLFKDAFERIAYMILPALPDGVLSVRGLLTFGVRQARTELLSFFLFMVLAGGVVALVPLMTGPLLESVVPERDRGLLVNAIVFLGTLFVVNLMTRFATGITEVRIHGRIGLFLRAAAIDRSIRIAAQHDQTGSPLPPAPVAALSARSVVSFHRGVWDIVLGVAASLLVAAPSIWVIAGFSGPGALLVAAVILVFLVAGGLNAMRRFRALLAGLAAPQSWMITAHDSLSMIDTVRATASEGRVFSRWTDGFLTLRHRFLRADRAGVVTSVLDDAVAASLTLAAVIALALAGDLTRSASPIGVIVATGSVAGAVSALLGAFGNTTMLALQLRMIKPLLNGEPVAARSGWAPPELSGGIDCEGLICRYRAGGPAVLDGVDFSIQPGEHIGIAGPSGAGKSTLVKAILGMVPREAGVVRYDGFDLDRLDDRALRRQIGVVGQNGRLFPGTLYDNIAAGAHISLDEAADAARQAGLETELDTLPLGLATPIGDAESGFSGGQVQRVLLARAFASKPKILVLDEATSALDEDIQDRVSQAIDTMGATVISIAHRLETLRRCDRILVLEGGRLVEQGPFDDLVAGGGLFAELVAAEDAT